MKLDQDIRPITDLKRSASELVQAVTKNSRPIVITQHGRARAVLLDIASYDRLKALQERDQRGRAIEIMLQQAEADLAVGRVHSTDEVFARARARPARSRSKAKARSR